jgi:hypothetical protein
VAVRKCPSCQTVVPAELVVAYTDNVVCPACKAELTVSNSSRFLASLAGILAGILAWQLTSSATVGALAWTLPLLCSFLAFGVVSALVLMCVADLRPQPIESVVAPLASQPLHGTSGAHH